MEVSMIMSFGVGVLSCTLTLATCVYHTPWNWQTSEKAKLLIIAPKSQFSAIQMNREDREKGECSRTHFAAPWIQIALLGLSRGVYFASRKSMVLWKNRIIKCKHAIQALTFSKLCSLMLQLLDIKSPLLQRRELVSLASLLLQGSQRSHVHW